MILGGFFFFFFGYTVHNYGMSTLKFVSQEISDIAYY